MGVWSVASLALLLVACQRGPFPEGGGPTDPERAPRRAAPLPSSPAGRALVEGETRFAAALYRQVASAPGSVVVSPYGVLATLGMLREGARGTTAGELDATLGLGGDAAQGWPWLYGGLKSTRTLRSASAVWLERRVPASEEFVRAVSERHGAGRETFDGGKPQATADVVNAWASRHTEGRIPEILSAADVAPDVRLLLANAVYFKGRWETEFPRGATREEDFHPEPGRTLRVRMMHVHDSFELRTIGAARVLSLPHRGGETELQLVLPDAGHTLAQVEQELADGALTTWGGERHWADVQVFLPRFRVESRHALVPALTALGAGEAFRPGADLGGVGIHDPLGPLFVNDLRQRALLECDEQGTTAAAVTVAVASCSAPIARPEVFRCDQPFLFVLRHVPTGAILFVGRYAG